MPFKPSVPGEVPTLGFLVIDWMEALLCAPDTVDYEPLRLYREQAEFILDWYELDPITGRRRYTRGVLSRARGWGKSPIMAGLAIVEGLGPVLPAGWDANGRPVGMPWRSRRTPLVHVAAVSEDQTKNTWIPLLEMLHQDAPIHDEYPGINPMQTFVDLGGLGRIDRVTASPKTLKGAKALFGVLDQTEAWVDSNKGTDLAIVMRANAAKVGGTTLESPNAFIPGEDSVAQGSADYWSMIKEGIAEDESLYYNHREAPATTDIENRPSLISGLRVAYGDTSAHSGGCVLHTPPCPPGHVDLDRLISTIYDPKQPIQNSRSDFLNQVTHHSDAWISAVMWNSCFRPERIVVDGDMITMGFDGSHGRRKGKADATALVGCRVSDGHMFEIKVWEQPLGSAGKHWMAPTLEVDAAVRMAFEKYHVVGFYTDPNMWTEYVVKWEAAYGRKLKIKAPEPHPMMMWPRGKTPDATHHVDRLRVAIMESAEAWSRHEADEMLSIGEFSHDGSFYLTKHVINARMRKNPTGYLLYKAYPESWDKIDAAYAGVLAWRARLDAVAKGLAKPRKTSQAVTL